MSSSHKLLYICVTIELRGTEYAVPEFCGDDHVGRRVGREVGLRGVSFRPKA